EVVPISVMHHKMPVYGFRIGDFTYVTDANYISENERAKIRGSKVLVINALQRESHISHFTLPQALEVISDLQVPRAYLTHISHRLGRHSSVELPPHVSLAHDGLQIEIDWSYMHLNYFFLRKLAAALKPRVEGTVLLEAFSQDKDEIVLKFGREGREVFVIRALLKTDF